MKCPKCNTTMGKKKKSKIEVILLDEKDIEFLKESNAIESEYSNEALEDAKTAYVVAFKKRKKINIELIKEIHFELLKNLNNRIAGKIRKCPIYVGNSITYKECLKPEKINKALDYWIKTYSKLKKDFEIKEAHVQFEEIHPFEDGNGRVGRILMNIQRLNANLPIMVIYEKEKSKYYKWFKTRRISKQRGNQHG